LGDVDGDSDLDSVVAHNNQPTAVWLNDGSGHFGSPRLTLSVAVARWMWFWGRGWRRDLMPPTAQGAADEEVWLNDGHGYFGCRGL
jgi:hypothetical protein